MTTAARTYIESLRPGLLESQWLGIQGKSQVLLSMATKKAISCFIVTPAAGQAFLLADPAFTNRLEHYRAEYSIASKQEQARLKKTIEHFICRQSIPKEVLDTFRSTYQTYIKQHSFWIESDTDHSESICTLPETIYSGASVFYDQLRQSWAREIAQVITSTNHEPLIGLSLPSLLVFVIPPFLYSGIVVTRLNNHDKHKLLIEASAGVWLEEGFIRRDRYVWNVDTRSVYERHLDTTPDQAAYNRHGSINLKKVKKGTLPTSLLTDDTVTEIATIARSIRNYHLKPQNMLFIVDKYGAVSILKSTSFDPSDDLATSSSSGKLLAKGVSVYPGIVTGHVKIVDSLATARSLKAGEIAVIRERNFHLDSQLLKHCGALVTPDLDMTHSLAFWARESGIPTIFGVDVSLLSDKTVVVVDARSGIITKPTIPDRNIKLPQVTHISVPLTLATKLLVTVNDIAQIEQVSKLDVDGIGVLRTSLLLADMGKHISQYQHSSAKKQLVAALTKAYVQAGTQFGSRPVTILASDLTPKHWRHFENGSTLETHESDESIGYRGAHRILLQPEIFSAELTALETARSEYGIHTLNLLLPYLRTPEELVRLKRLIAAHGLHRGSGFKLFVSLDIPCNVAQLEAFAKAGIDGIYLNIESLLTLYSGTNPRSAEVGRIYTEDRPELLSFIHTIVTTAKTLDIPVLAYSQSISRSPELARQLIRDGVFGLSIDPSSIDRHRELAYTQEHNNLGVHI